MTTLQQDHSHARSHGADHVEAESDTTSAEVGCRESSGSTGGGRALSGARLGACLSTSTDGTGTLGTSSREHGSTARGSRRSDSSLGGGLALETTAARDSLSIGVESEGELLLGRAHAVGAVWAGSGVLVDACAVLSLLLTTDEAEHVTVVLLVNLVSDNAAESLLHAGAERRIGRGRKRVRDGLPLSGGDLGAGSSSSVGGVVVSHLDAAGSGLGDLLGQVVEVLVGGDLAAGDGCET